MLICSTKGTVTRLHMVGCPLWQYGLWRFQMGGTKVEGFLPKNQHTQRKLLNFENLISGGSEVFKNQSFINQLFSSSHSPN